MARSRGVAATAAVTLVACGGSSSGESDPPRAPTGADEVVVRVETAGGYLAETGRVSGVTPEQRAQRRRLEQFIDRAGDAGTFGDDLVPRSERRYGTASLAVLVRPTEPTDADVHAWPLGDLAGTDCVVFTGVDAATATAAARGASDGDAWASAGASYDLDFRPLLPDEHGCDDVTRR